VTVCLSATIVCTARTAEPVGVGSQGTMY